jgi:hypothetical protein
VTYLPRLFAALLTALALAGGISLQAEPPKAPTAKSKTVRPFIRIQKDQDGQPIALQTAVVRYAPASGQGKLTVDLVSAVHLGDRAYYDQLNKLMQSYDVLLYELVAPEGTRIPKGGRKAEGPLAILQPAVKLVLGLDWQVERIDYTRKNFVHADLSFDQMAEAAQKRGDDALTLALSVAADLLRQQNLQEQRKAKAAPAKQEEFDVTSLLEPEGAAKLKQLLAEQMVAAGSADAGLGPTLHTLLVADRNQEALKVFQRELAKGRTKIGIFYGAAHMPDFEKHLQEDFGLKRSSERWLTAWDLRPRERGLDALLEILKSLEP